MLHRVVLDHVETFFAAARRADGTGLPAFVEREFREFLTCGVLAGGFARFRCGGCGFERLVPFSCKGRGFCLSCGGRRMVERAAHLVDHVFPNVPVRQWVLSFPSRIRYLVAWDHALCRAVVRVCVRAILGFQRRQAARAGVRDRRGGAVAIVQRFGAALNLNVHVHALVMDGVFAEDGAGGLRFHAAAPPSDEEVWMLVATIRTRVLRLLRRRGLGDEGEGGAAPDPLSEETPVLAGIAAASVLGQAALGRRAGWRVRRDGDGPVEDGPRGMGPRHARVDGFDLHANVAVSGRARRTLERVCRYTLRPPIAQGRIHLTDDGQVVLQLRHPWRDGTTRLVFDPVEFLERLAALTPRPRVNLVLYHGVLAPGAAWRARVVASGAVNDRASTSSGVTPGDEAEVPPDPVPADGRWADWMRRSFGFDVLSCARCGGRLRLVATIEDPAVVGKILRHLGLPAILLAPRPPPVEAVAASFVDSF